MVDTSIVPTNTSKGTQKPTWFCSFLLSVLGVVTDKVTLSLLADAITVGAGSLLGVDLGGAGLVARGRGAGEVRT